MRLHQLRIPSLIAAFGLCAGAAFAQAYPSKMLTMIVPWPAGAQPTWQVDLLPMN